MSRWRRPTRTGLPPTPLHRKLADFDGKLDGLRKQIVATTEGGAITGEERLREHTDQLYGAIMVGTDRRAPTLWITSWHCETN